jgi:FkbM family methyltransferase
MLLVKRAVIKFLLRPLSENLGFPKWCRKPSHNDLDFKLSKGLKWKGLLIEAVPALYEKCKRLRKRSFVIQGALVSKDYNKKTLKIFYANLMSAAEGAMKPKALNEHIKQGIKCQGIKRPYSFEANAITLKEALSHTKFPKIDFMSLDLEGYEIEALRGFDFTIHRPHYILIEVHDPKLVDSFFSSIDYLKVDELSNHDYLYKDNQVCNS